MRKTIVITAIVALVVAGGGGIAAWALVGGTSGSAAPDATGASDTPGGGLFTDVTGTLERADGGGYRLTDGDGRAYAVDAGGSGLLVPYVDQRVTVTGTAPQGPIGRSPGETRHLTARLVRSHAQGEQILERGTTTLRYEVNVEGGVGADTRFYGLFGVPGPDPTGEAPSVERLGLVALREDGNGVHTAEVGLRDGQRTIARIARGTLEEGPTAIIHPDSVVQRDSTITLDGDTTISTTYRADGGQPPGRGQAALTDARVGRHDTFDRVAFDFADRLPSNPTVEHRDDPVVRAPGSGKPVELRGDSALRVTFEGTRLAADPAPHVVRDYPVIREVRVLGGFEGHVTVGVGVAAEEAAPHIGRDEDSVYIDVARGGDGGTDPATRACGDVAFEENTDHGAFDVRARGVRCELARDVAAAADGHGGESFSASGFSCDAQRRGGELPSYAYTCGRGQTEQVTFSVS